MLGLITRIFMFRLTVILKKAKSLIDDKMRPYIALGSLRLSMQEMPLRTRRRRPLGPIYTCA